MPTPPASTWASAPCPPSRHEKRALGGEVRAV
jgi:hypothetical protein